MISFLKKYRKELVVAGLVEMTKGILTAVLTASVLTFIAQGLIFFFAILANFTIPIMVMSITGGLLAGIKLFQFFHRRTPRLPPLDCDFRILHKEISYQYVDKTRMIYKKRILLKALKNGLDSYRDKYAWTGRGIINIKSNMDGQIYQETKRKSVWQHYQIQFPYSLKKGDVIETEIVGELEDRDGIAVPFISATITEPTDLLTLSVSLARELGVKEVFLEESSSITLNKPLNATPSELNRDGKYTWNIPRPRILWHYEMAWSFPNSRN